MNDTGTRPQDNAQAAPPVRYGIIGVYEKCGACGAPYFRPVIVRGCGRCPHCRQVS